MHTHLYTFTHTHNHTNIPEELRGLGYEAEAIMRVRVVKGNGD